ncbi:hypothetical protein Rhopal_002600-T1 [Rhodotorula paludigena]|uniref:Uncharacterized protein n=1 Tax=Rhodotorula paludigena TaxID=86838 RepID=A0AAV5GHA1_9BASI|nr:hypothetical protein Rhopal_002600-T1 [Rhodotorula paludigena]
MPAERSSRPSPTRDRSHEAYSGATEHGESIGPEVEVDELEEPSDTAEVKREPGIGDDVSHRPWKKSKNDEDEIGRLSGTPSHVNSPSKGPFKPRASSATPAFNSAIGPKPRASSAAPFRPFDFAPVTSPSKKRSSPPDEPSSTTVAELKDELARALSDNQKIKRTLSASRAENTQLQKALDEARADAQNAHAESHDATLKYEKIRALQIEFQDKLSHFSDRVTTAARSWADNRDGVVEQLSMPGVATPQNMRMLFESADAHITEMYGAWNEAVGTPDSQGPSGSGTSAAGASPSNPKKQVKPK